MPAHTSFRRGVTALSKKGSYDPLTALPWAHVCWASDPDWAHPNDGILVPLWRNAVNPVFSPSQVTGLARPIYRSSLPKLNEKPGLEFDGGDWLRIDVNDLTQPFSLVAIGYLTSVATASRFVSFASTGTTQGLGRSGNNSWVTNAGATLNSGITTDLNPHLYASTLEGDSGWIYVDGIIAQGNTSTGIAEQFVVGSSSAAGNTFLTGVTAFVGILPGRIRNQLGWPDFIEWATDYYELAIN